MTTTPSDIPFTAAKNTGIELELSEGLQAGFPSPAADFSGEHIDIVREITPHPETTFYARVVGESMRDAGIFSGDIAVIDRSLQARNGSIVVACVNNEFTLKEFQLDSDGQGAWLIPHNPAFEKLHVGVDDNFMVWGVVTHTIHKTC